jgi:hypothetical protein
VMSGSIPRDLTTLSVVNERSEAQTVRACRSSAVHITASKVTYCTPGKGGGLGVGGGGPSSDTRRRRHRSKK